MLIDSAASGSQRLAINRNIQTKIGAVPNRNIGAGIPASQVREGIKEVILSTPGDQ